MRFDIDAAEIDMPAASVIVNSEVSQPGVPALEDFAVNEGWSECPVAVLARDVVGSELRRLYMLHQQPHGRPVAHDAGTQDRTVLVPVAGKQMLHDSLVILGSHQNVARLSGHRSSSRKCNTLTNLAAAV